MSGRHPTCPRLAALHSAQIGVVVCDQDFISEAARTLDPHYRDLYVPARIARFAGARVDETDGVSISLAVFRPLEAEPFAEVDLDRIGNLIRACLPVANHIGRLRRRENGLLLRMFEPTVATALFDRSGVVIESNDTFQGMVSAGRIGMRPSGRLRLPVGLETRFQQSLADTRHAPSARRMVITDEQDGSKLVASILGVPTSEGLTSNASAIVTIEPVAGRRTRLDLDLVAATFGLTNTEALVAAMLWEGQSPREIAGSRRVTLHTVRSMIKSIMRKTETSRQAELITQLAGIAHRSH